MIENCNKILSFKNPKKGVYIMSHSNYPRISCGVASITNLPTNRYLQTLKKRKSNEEIIEELKRNFNSILRNKRSAHLILSDTDKGGKELLSLVREFCLVTDLRKNPNSGSYIYTAVYFKE